jgi:hypothetical protein
VSRLPGTPTRVYLIRALPPGRAEGSVFSTAALVPSARARTQGADFFSILVTIHIPQVSTPLAMRCATFWSYHREENHEST